LGSGGEKLALIVGERCECAVDGVKLGPQSRALEAKFMCKTVGRKLTKVIISKKRQKAKKIPKSILAEYLQLCGNGSCRGFALELSLR
jgi:hypothetical protein